MQYVACSAVPQYHKGTTPCNIAPYLHRAFLHIVHPPSSSCLQVSTQRSSCHVTSYLCARPVSLHHSQHPKLASASSSIWASLSTSSHSLTINNRPTITYVPLPEPAHDSYDSRPTNYIQLIGALSKARDLAKLQKLVDEYQDK